MLVEFCQSTRLESEAVVGLPQSTTSQCFQGHPNNGRELLKLPSGNLFRVIQINGLGGNNQSALEIL